MARIIILRHGNTFDPSDVVTRVGGRTDLPLSNSGVAQAKAIAAHFKGQTFTHVYCSPLRRTRQTAEIVAGRAETLPFLTEIDYGPDENKPEAEVVARLGQEAIEAWDSAAIVPNGWRVNPAQIKSDWTAFLAAYADQPGDILVVTSNGTARFLFDVTHTAEAFERKLKTGAYGTIAYHDGFPTITSWNIRP
ncbi:histidine phosphatase family protein [Litorimonas sp. RW-G-Af-16]|uniref:histidine phosphatase family protein n=1 Tax=Litorimonas sp. RW-G-Af-16 TaxID=3241168 RepID=UPI00390CCB08